MVAFEPQFTWGKGVINEKALPVIIRSVNPTIPGKGPVIARTRVTGPHLRATTSTELAIKATTIREKG